MAYADEQSYEEMIAALHKFSNAAEEQCSVMEKAGQDCVDNTDNDPAAVASTEKLQGCVSGIRSALSEVADIISALQQELEDIREAAAKAAYND